jgi:hypothetical protein
MRFSHEPVHSSKEFPMKRSFKHSAVAVALAAFAGVALAQSTGSPSAPMTPSPSTATSPATTPSGTTMQPQAGTPASPHGTRMPSAGDTPDAAWRTLDSSNRGYLQRNDVQNLGIPFEQADSNKDGRLSKEEFQKAWSAKK